MEKQNKVLEHPSAQAQSVEALPGAGAMAVRPPAALASRELIVKDALTGMLPSSIGEAMQVSNFLAKSKAVPKYLFGKPETVFTIILAGLEIGLTPIRAIQNLQNIHGNLGMKADLQLALVRKSGLMTYFDEGYEERDVTDTDLATRTRDGAKILALVKALPKSKPYGWTTMQRRGDEAPITKVFSWADAERAFTYEKDDDDDNAKSTKKKLSEKFNYQSWPQDMYPKRSRARVIQMAFPDVTAGIPSIEHLQDKAIVEGEVITASDDDTPDADQLLLEILTADEALGKRIDGGFTQLKIAGAKKLAKLVEYRGKPNDLLAWLQNEYALQKTGSPKAAADVLGGTNRPEPETKPAPAETIPPKAETKQPDPEPKPKPWQATNQGTRNSWVEHGDPVQRFVLMPGESADLDVEPDGMGKGVVITRRPEGHQTQAAEHTTGPAVHKTDPETHNPEPDTVVQGEVVHEPEPTPAAPKSKLNKMAALKDLPTI